MGKVFASLVVAFSILAVAEVFVWSYLLAAESSDCSTWPHPPMSEFGERLLWAGLALSGLWFASGIGAAAGIVGKYWKSPHRAWRILFWSSLAIGAGPHMAGTLCFLSAG